MPWAGGLAPHLAPATAIALSGPLGAGKGAFARALVSALLGDPRAEVPSPTFTFWSRTTTAPGPAAMPVAVHHFSTSTA